MSKITGIEIKNGKICEFMSEETTCFECSVHVQHGEGKPYKKVAIVSNGGHGGPTDYANPKGGWVGNDLLAELAEYVWALAPRPEGDNEFALSIKTLKEIQLESYIIAAIDARKIARNFKSRVYVALKGDVAFYRWTGVRQITERHIDSIKGDPKKGRVLNGMNQQQLAVELMAS